MSIAQQLIKSSLTGGLLVFGMSYLNNEPLRVYTNLGILTGITSFLVPFVSDRLLDTDHNNLTRSTSQSIIDSGLLGGTLMLGARYFPIGPFKPEVLFTGAVISDQMAQGFLPLIVPALVPDARPVHGITVF